MKKWLGYLLFGLCSYAIFLIGTLPATHIYHLAKEQLPDISLHTIEGTIWDGSARQLQVGNLQTGPLFWTFKPLSLLLIRAEFQLSTTGKKLKATGRAGISLTGKRYLSDVKGESSIETILSLIPTPPITPEGGITFDFEEITFRNQRLSTLTGIVDWQRARIKQPIDIQIGNLNMVFNTDDKGIHGKISDKGALLGVNGQLELQPDGRYQISGKVQPKPTTPEDLRNALNILGQADPTGAIPLNFSGKI